MPHTNINALHCSPCLQDAYADFVPSLQATPVVLVAADCVGLQQLLLAALLAPQRVGVSLFDASFSRKLAKAGRVHTLLAVSLKALASAQCSAQSSARIG